MSTDNTNNIQAAINLAMAYAENKQFAIEVGGNDIPAVLVPDGYSLKTFEDHREAPLRIKSVIETDTVESWLSYWNRFSYTESTAIFDLPAAKLVGYIDYHETTGIANWLDHHLIYQCPITPEWKRWKENSGKVMDQIAFARFIEDAIPDITDPTGADMLEIAKSLTVHNKVNFRQAIRLDNGETQFTYEENLEGQAGPKGQLKIPQTITLGIRLFDGGPGYSVEARFRYSIKEARLSMWYDLVRPERVHEAAVMDIYQAIKDGMKLGHLIRGRIQ